MIKECAQYLVPFHMIFRQVQRIDLNVIKLLNSLIVSDKHK